MFVDKGSIVLKQAKNHKKRVNARRGCHDFSSLACVCREADFDLAEWFPKLGAPTEEEEAAVFMVHSSASQDRAGVAREKSLAPCRFLGISKTSILTIVRSESCRRYLRGPLGPRASPHQA
jgi:hypothetical protein